MTDSVNSTPATILIADDYEDNRELLRFLLTGANYIVLEAQNGEECVVLAKTQKPDLVLVDLSMPGLDGWGVFRELRADPLTARIPCMAVTAHDLDRSRALEMGFDGYVPKPFRAGDLLNVVQIILSNQKALSERT